ncbi:MAG: hypothetical protein ACLFWD_02805 [Anaerolineales bacterium]
MVSSNGRLMLAAYDLRKWLNLDDLARLVAGVCKVGGFVPLEHLPHGPEDQANSMDLDQALNLLQDSWHENLKEYEREPLLPEVVGRVYVHLRHPCLQRVSENIGLAEYSLRLTATEYVEDLKTLAISVDMRPRAGEPDSGLAECEEPVAQGYVRAGKFLASHFSPLYLWIAEVEDAGLWPQRSEITSNGLPGWYWATYVTEQLMKPRDREILDSIAPVTVEHIGEGFWVQVTEQFSLEKAERLQVVSQFDELLNQLGPAKIHWKAD